MQWFVSAWNSDTGRSTIRVGDALDLDGAIAEALHNGRNLTHADDGSPVGTSRNFRFDDGDVVSIANVHSVSAEEDIRREMAHATRLRTPEEASTKHPTPSGSVVEQWNRIRSWLESNLMDISITGAADEEVAAAAVETWVNWHDELRTFYGLINGFPSDHWVALFPLHELFDLGRLLNERRIELEVWGEIDKEMGATPPRSTPAGLSTGTYLPEFVPFAGMDGYLLFVDMRGGPLFGCVTEFDKVDADQGGPKWLSLSAMLTGLAASLETGALFDGQWRPRVVDGKLSWESASSSA